MYIADGNYVLTTDNATYCVCYGPNSLFDAAKVAMLLNYDLMQRIPHPATDMQPMTHLCEMLRGDPVGRHD